MAKPHQHNLIRDLAIVAFSIVLAYYIWQAQLVEIWLTFLPEAKLISAFIAGFFFTSVFTIAPAAIALVKIAQFYPLWAVALAGAAGAVIGDLIIFYFIRDHLTEDFLELLKHETSGKKIRHIFRSKIMKFSLAIVGALLIASPLPDELGLALLGMSKIKSSLFIPVSFLMNFLGVILINIVARSL